MSSPVIIPLNYIERKPNSDYYRIVGKGVTVEFLSRLIDDPAWTMERICENYSRGSPCRMGVLLRTSGRDRPSAGRCGRAFWGVRR